MRQGLFAILLILAAFSGGALVNGPGLAWIRGQLAGSNAPDFVEGADSDALAVDGADGVPIPVVTDPNSGQATDPDTSSPSPPLPVAQTSPFANTDATEGTESNDSADPAATADPPTVRAPKGPTIATASTSAASAESEAPPATSGPTRATPIPPPSLLDAARSRLSDRSITQVSDPDPPASPSPPAPDAGSPTATTDPNAVPWADAPDSAAPARPVLPDPGNGPDAAPASDPNRDDGVRLAGNPDVTASDPRSDDWAAVRRRMEELGVGRYWIEGEFGGPVVFRCVVPVVGDRAVSQHFEAEGDDLLSAARDALRRIALWRATEASP